jgi:hypothetical protein
MCLAIYKPKGIEISKSCYRNAFSENQDGCGFAYSKNGHVKVEKFFDFKSFWQAIKPVQGKHNMLVHFRLATHGDKTLANVHPIVIEKGRFAVIHNGIIPIQTQNNDSDTVTFARDVLAPCFKRFDWRDATLKYLVETSIGSDNKIVALNHKGEAQIFNEKSGHWHKGAWYSNHGYQNRSHWYSNIQSYASNCVSKWSGLPRSGIRTTPQQPDVFDELDEAQIEAQIKACSTFSNLGVADRESSNTLDYDGTSNHSKPLRHLYYKSDGKGGLVEDHG